MKLRNDDKYEEELTCRFKIDTRSLTNFDSSKILLTKVYNDWAKKAQMSYLSTLESDVKPKEKLTCGLKHD